MQRTFSKGTKKFLKTAKSSAIFPQKKCKDGAEKDDGADERKF